MKTIQRTSQNKKAPLFFVSEVIKNNSTKDGEASETIKEYLTRKSISGNKSKQNKTHD